MEQTDMTCIETTSSDERIGGARTGIIVACLVALMPMVGIPAIAEADEPAPAVPQWTSPTEIPVDFDWLQFESGEWLKGEIKALYDDRLEFDSDQMELLKLDWEDVRELRSHAPVSARFEGIGVVEGIIRITPDTVFIIDGDTTRTFPERDDFYYFIGLGFEL